MRNKKPASKSDPQRERRLPQETVLGIVAQGDTKFFQSFLRQHLSQIVENSVQIEAGKIGTIRKLNPDRGLRKLFTSLSKCIFWTDAVNDMHLKNRGKTLEIDSRLCILGVRELKGNSIPKFE